MFDRKLHRTDMLRCTLCQNAPCSSVCKKIDCASMLRSIWLENEKTAASRLPAENPCVGCPAPCEAACVRAHEVPIRELITRLHDEVKPELELSPPEDENRLCAEFCGIPLENPFLLSSSVVASTYDMCARAFDAGWAGVAYKTICSFPIHEASPRFSAITGDSGSIIGFKNIEQLSDHSVAENMEIFRRLKRNYPTKFILASIMGQNEKEWEELARLCEENGADAIELNFSCPNMADGGLGSDIGQVPALVERYTAAARRGAKIPILAKLTPNVKSIIGVSPHTYVSAPAVHGMSAVGGYSGNAVKPIALRFIAELAQNPVLAGMHLSAMGGVETWQDALEFLLLGAGSIQATTAVMQYGYRIIDDLKAGLNLYLAEKGLDSVEATRGLALDSVSETTDVLERDTIVFPKFHREKCIGCGRCFISCADGCVGCHLCVLVCPQRAISSSRKRIAKKQ